MFFTIALIVVNVVVYALPNLINFRGPSLSSTQNFLMMGWKDNAEIRDGEYYRLFTSNFLHADLTHLFVNMFSLFNVGPFVNQIYGNLGFSLIYFLSGIFSSLTSFWFNPSPSVGASGAIFGLVGALLAFSLFNFEEQSGLLANILIVIAINVAIAFFSPQIDNWGHMGGLVCGFLIGTLLIFSGQLQV